MKVGDLVTYGKWFNGPPRIGVVLEAGLHYSSWFIMWSDYEPEWEMEDELEVLSESR
tara:strand:- start:160 stop:330 length:171 start_codon:yes stop_codon:yes gene_type:complete